MSRDSPHRHPPVRGGGPVVQAPHVLSVRMNDAAAGTLGPRPLVAELTPRLRALVAEGVVLRGEVLVFAGHADRADTADRTDLTGWECTVSSFHLDDVVPVRVGHLDSRQPVVSEADQLLMLRHGVGFALEIVRLVRELPESVAVRCIVSANSTNGTFRFHRIRSGESWLQADLDGYRSEKVVVVDGGPSSALNAVAGQPRA
ncbi:hypothetical protein [Actinophytocola glycyrrhizae]|uniref:Uncharacterized protein n=1 Tax=Actinophytocola glycyrrhizae TaxID=2044873 RepID=A0ABV9SDP5_9PSEU